MKKIVWVVCVVGLVVLFVLIKLFLETSENLRSDSIVDKQFNINQEMLEISIRFQKIGLATFCKTGESSYEVDHDDIINFSGGFYQLTSFGLQGREERLIDTTGYRGMTIDDLDTVTHFLLQSEFVCLEQYTTGSFDSTGFVSKNGDERSRSGVLHVTSGIPDSTIFRGLRNVEEGWYTFVDVQY